MIFPAICSSCRNFFALECRVGYLSAILLQVCIKVHAILMSEFIFGLMVDFSNFAKIGLIRDRTGYLIHIIGIKKQIGIGPVL